MECNVCMYIYMYIVYIYMYLCIVTHQNYLDVPEMTEMWYTTIKWQF